LKKVVQTICSSAAYVYLYKVKSYIGIIGNECADAIANYQVKQDKNNAETVVPNAEADGNPFYNSSWLAFEEVSASTQAPNPPAPRLKTSQTSRMLSRHTCT